MTPLDSRGTVQEEDDEDNAFEKVEYREAYVRTETTTAIAMPGNELEKNGKWEKLVGYDKFGNAITESNKQLFLDETARVRASA